MSTSRRNPRRNRSRRVLMSMSGVGLLKSWITFHVPTWLLIGVLLVIVTMLAAIVISPEFGASVGLALLELLRRSASNS